MAKGGQIMPEKWWLLIWKVLKWCLKLIIKIKPLENEGFLAKKIHSIIQNSYKSTKMGTEIDGEHIGGVL